MQYAEALEQQVAALQHVRELRRHDGQESGEAEAELARMLEYGESYFWARQLCNVIHHAVESFPDSWRWSPETLPTREGFIWFQQPMVWETARVVADRFEPLANVSITALAWSFARIRETGDRVLNVVPFAPGRLHPMPLLIVQFPEGQSIRQRLDDKHLMALNKLRHYDGQEYMVADVALKTIGACLTFLEQRILIAPQRRAERHARKRLARQGYQHEPLIRVVELRRKQSRPDHGDDHDPVEWSCQWVVSGHWRQQWYPSLDAYQPRWIMPYVKGPEDKPLKPPRAKVFAVVR